MIGNDYIIGESSHLTTDAPKEFKKRQIRVNLAQEAAWYNYAKSSLKLSWQVSIEGNIASGKSTILKKLRQHKSVEVGVILVLLPLSCTASLFGSYNALCTSHRLLRVVM